MTSLSEFLRARITEDEEVAREASRVRETRTGDQWERSVHVYEDEVLVVGATERSRLVGKVHRGATHIARHDPARVLAECEAKRRIVADLAPFLGETPLGYLAAQVLEDLAAPYADHPDYQPEWRP